METQSPYLKTDDAARYLGLSPSLLNKLRLTGGGPVFVRLAGRAAGQLQGQPLHRQVGRFRHW